MSEPTNSEPITAAERREAEAQRKAQEEQTRASTVRTFEAHVLNLVVQTAQQNTMLGWDDISGALERATAAAKALAGKK